MTTETNKTKKAAPVEIIENGVLRAAIWKNKTTKGPRYSITFEQQYTNRFGQTRFTRSFNNPDLPDLAELVVKAHKRVRILSQRIIVGD